MQRLELTFKELWVYIGIYDYERLHRQPVHITVQLFDYTLGSEPFIDYQLLQDLVTFVMEKGRFYLLEDACQAITYSLQPIVKRARCNVSIYKPKALVSSVATVGWEQEIEGYQDDTPFERDNLKISIKHPRINLLSHGESFSFNFGDYSVHTNS